MKVTAFIRKTSAKNNVTDLARVYFRVRDIGGVDIKAASELSISPNHWSAEKQGYKPRVALVSEEKRMNFDRDIQQITHLITKEYHRGVDGNWLKRLIEEYHHPDINAAALDTRFTPFNAFGVGGDKRHLRPLVAVVVKQYPCADEHSHNRKDPDR